MEIEGEEIMIWILIIAILIIIVIFSKRKKPIEQSIPTINKKTEVLLSVPYQKTQGKNWCLPACGAMILGFYNEKASQKEIAEKTMIENKTSVFKFMNYMRGFGFLVGWEIKPIEEIEDLLREEIPLIVIQNYSINIKESHSRVIVGFNSIKSEINLHDPSGQKGYNISYETFHNLGFNTSGKEKIITIRR